MALSLGDIDSWDTGALEEYSRQLARRSRTFAELGQSIADAGTIPGWTGQGADAAHARFGELSTDIADRAATVGAITELVTSLIDQVKALKGSLDDARAHAAEFGLVITDDGAVIDGVGAGGFGAGGAGVGGAGGDGAGGERDEAKELARAEIAAQVRAILELAADVEADTTAILSKAADGGFTGAGLSVDDASEKGQSEADAMFAAPPPPDDIEAQQHYLDALSDDQREEILRERPEWLANAYGIDPAVREEAATSYLAKLEDEYTAELAPLLREKEAFLEENPPGPKNWATNQNALHPLNQQIEGLEIKLADLEEIREQTAFPDTHLLGLRPHDEGVGAVVSRGDIATADHVAVNVPGTGTTSRDGLSGELAKLTALENEMEEHLRVVDRDHETYATVTYLNQPQPPSLPEARHTHYADTAAPDLAGVLNGINATSADGTNLTALGHSYGALTASEALQAGGAVDNVVFYGAPGLETSGEQFDADSLGVDPANRYVMHAAEEEIQLAHAVDPFGGVPQESPGLTRLGTSAHEDKGLVASTGHSQYHLDDSTSLNNFAAVAAGTPEAAIAYDPEKFDADNYHQVLGVNILPKWPL